MDFTPALESRAFLSDFDLAKKVKVIKAGMPSSFSTSSEGLIQGYDVLGLEEAVIRGLGGFYQG